MLSSTPNIVIDSNVLFSGLYSRRGASFQVLKRIGQGFFEVHISVPVFLEYEELLLQKREMLDLSRADITSILDYICSVATLHNIHYLWRPTLKDPDDEMILELAVSANCSHIVTYNKQDFAGATSFNTEVITPKELLEEIGGIL